MPPAPARSASEISHRVRRSRRRVAGPGALIVLGHDALSDLTFSTDAVAGLDTVIAHRDRTDSPIERVAPRPSFPVRSAASPRSDAARSPTHAGLEQARSRPRSSPHLRGPGRGERSSRAAGAAEAGLELGYEAEVSGQPASSIAIAFKTVFILVIVVVVFSPIMTWVERKQSALMQDRVGANRASILGVS